MIYHYYAFYKPYGCLSQFSGEESDKLIGDYYSFPKDVYSIGRLDKDSEGLLLLTNDNRFKTKLLDPSSKKRKTYLVQVEGEITPEAINLLEQGNLLLSHKGKKYKTLPGTCLKVDTPNVSERNPPIRYRANIPTSWIELTIVEGKNRQVRKMCAAVGFPTLRLIRISIGNYPLHNLQPGEVIELNEIDLQKVLGLSL